jgi:hypothetical protein
MQSSSEDDERRPPWLCRGSAAAAVVGGGVVKVEWGAVGSSAEEGVNANAETLIAAG